MSEDDAPDPDGEATVRALIRQGEYLKAHDRAQPLLEAAPDNVTFKHLSTLALARAGATEQALGAFRDLGLTDVHSEEVTSLYGRLNKDIGLATSGPARTAALRRAIDAYTEAFQLDEGYFPAINVATLSALTDQAGPALTWAERALALAEKAADRDSYYAQATRAEALLLLGRTAQASAAIVDALAAPGAGYGSRSSTLKQMRLIVAKRGLSDEVLAPLTPPPVMHYCGHIIAAAGAPGRFPAEQEAAVAAGIAELIEAHPVSSAIGSLAAGADILAAEALLAAGVDLDVVIPFALDDFIEASVRPAGERWVPRMHDCLKRAREVHYVTEDRHLGDDELFGYASEFALGLASVRSEWLSTDVYQLAVWDGEPLQPGAVAGTAHDLALGARIGATSRIVPVQPLHAPDDTQPPQVQASPTGQPTKLGRVCRGVVFGDLKGFSGLTDAQLPNYVEHVLGACAAAIHRFKAHVRFSNTWGDAVFVVFDDLAAAADCANALQEAVEGLRDQDHGLPSTLGLRLSFHYGPVYEARDPVLERQNYFGYHVSWAARVEPITPVGSVYVTEQAAAALAVQCPGRYRSEYVGEIDLPKGFGAFPMYRLWAL